VSQTGGITSTPSRAGNSATVVNAFADRRRDDLDGDEEDAGQLPEIERGADEVITTDDERVTR